MTENPKPDDKKEGGTYGLDKVKVYTSGFSAYLPVEATEKLIAAFRTEYPCTIVSVRESLVEKGDTKVDTWWTLLRWRISVWMLWRALRIAPDGSAAVDLEDHLLSWAERCRMEWHKRYPHPELARNGDSSEPTL